MRPMSWQLLADTGMTSFFERALPSFSLEALRVHMALPFEVWGLTIRFTSPQWALLVLVALFVPLLALRSMSDMSRPRRVGLFFAQLAFISGISWALMQPMLQRGKEPKSRVLLFDVSDSISEAGLAQARLFLLEHQKSGEALSVILFGAQARLVEPSLLAKRSWRSLVDTTGSHLSGALKLGHAHCPAATDCHLYLHSDGLENKGNALAETAQLRAAGRTVHVKSYGVTPPDDLGVIGFSAPQNIRAGESFYLELKLRAFGKGKGRLVVTRQKPSLAPVFEESISLTSQQRTLRIKTSALGSGDHEYLAEFIPEQVERFSQNNQARLAFSVPEAPRVLLLDPLPRSAASLIRLLTAQRFIVEARRPSGFPTRGSALRAFDFIILSDVDRSQLSRRNEDMLVSYVRSGGALLVLGGEAAYAGGGWQSSQLFKILPVTINSQSERELPGVAMSLVIDRSGSMSGLPLSMAKEACKATVDLLKPTDLIEVIAFDSQPSRAVRLGPARAKTRINSSIMRVRPGGGTSFFRPLDLAFEDISSVRARKKHIILLTDGNGGTDGVLELARMAFAQGISLTTVGLGEGVNWALLEAIASVGGGRFHRVADASTLPKIFSRETELITQDKKLEDWLGVKLVNRPAFLRGISLAPLPLLRGMSHSQIRPTPAELIFMSETGEPVFARRPVAQGWTLAWASDLKSNQGREWLQWPYMGRLLAQMIRGHQQEKQETLFPLSVKKLGDSLVVRFERVRSDGAYQSDLNSTLKVKHLESKASTSSSFRLIAPGLYEARSALAGLGMYQIEASHQLLNVGGQQEVGRSFLPFSWSFPDEFLRLSPDLELLKSISRVGDSGSVIGSLSEKSRGGFTRPKEEDCSDFGIWFAVVFLILGLFIRRTRSFQLAKTASELP